MEPTDSKYVEAKQAEYDRWFKRGQEDAAKKIKVKDTILMNMRPGSNAYEAFADGFAGMSAPGPR